MVRNLNQTSIRVIQLSDCHLFQSPEGKLLGLNTEDSLAKVMDLIAVEQPHPDIVLATGDLSQDGSRDSYSRFHQQMAKNFKCPVYWLPGNHDLTDMMADYQAAQFMSPCAIDLGHWQIIMLDSTIRGKVPGNFAVSELQFLEQALKKSTGKHVMIALHHQPVPIGSEWLDQQIVGNAADFFKIVDGFENVRSIIWGHVHQDFRAERNGVTLMSVPSTCVQFLPGSKSFAVDSENPGYRWLDLYADGRVETDVSRVVGIDFEVDYSVKGY